MRKHAGFTLVELMVVIAILGILGATAVQCYRIIQQRACGSEAALMLKQILDAEIMYFLENETFFLEGATLVMTHQDPPDKAEIGQIRNALNITIPVGHHFDFTITADKTICTVTVNSPQNSFALFSDGSTSITGQVDDTGEIDMF